MIDRILGLVDRHWRLLTAFCWLVLVVYLVAARWHSINGFVLADTDDNMRLSQVRAWLNGGQGWYDLRQHKLDWVHGGANIHWSRLVDLPLAGLILLGRLFTDGAHAEIFAVAAAPLIPLSLLVLALVLIVRRLVDPRAWPLAILCLFFASSGLFQYAPTRIDHHGWQLAFLLIGVAGIADSRPARGGLVLGLASALSLAIGLEMIIYLVLAAATMGLFWIADVGERRRLATYAVSLGGGTAFSFLVFASYANRGPVCDALSPVWLSDVMLGSALLLALAWWSPASARARLLAALAAGLVVAGFHVMAWPHCLTRLEGVSPETYKLWLSHVREARPVYRHGWRFALTILALPTAALVGWAVLAWKVRNNPGLLRRVLGAAVPGIAATALLFWQSRTGPAAQLLAIPGCAALAAIAGPALANSRYVLVRTLGTAILVLFAAGAIVPIAIDFVAPDKNTPREKQVAKANASCPTLKAMRPVAELPPATIFTFADLSPRLITITHHRAIAGPYHRNGQAIVDSMRLFRGSADQARALLAKYHADYLMTCPSMSQATIFESEAPKGFYVQLQRGKVPPWLTPVDLGPGSPLKLWKVTG